MGNGNSVLYTFGGGYLAFGSRRPSGGNSLPPNQERNSKMSETPNYLLTHETGNQKIAKQNSENLKLKEVLPKPTPVKKQGSCSCC